jgi:hypothetical protein
MSTSGSCQTTSPQIRFSKVITLTLIELLPFQQSVHFHISEVDVRLSKLLTRKSGEASRIFQRTKQCARRETQIGKDKLRNLEVLIPNESKCLSFMVPNFIEHLVVRSPAFPFNLLSQAAFLQTFVVSFLEQTLQPELPTLKPSIKEIIPPKAPSPSPNPSTPSQTPPPHLPHSPYPKPPPSTNSTAETSNSPLRPSHPHSHSYLPFCS